MIFWWKYIRLFCFIFFISLCSIIKCNAQNSSIELWPETDIWYRLNPSWRLSSYIAVTKYYESKTRDLNITFQADYSWGHTENPFIGRLQDEKRAQTVKVWMVRSGFMEGQSLSDKGENYSEDMAFAEIHKRIPIKGESLLSMRFRTDYRWLGDSSPEFSYRLRYRVMYEKEYQAGKSSIVPYLSAEPFWDSRYEKINRIRLIGGATIARGHIFAFESNVTYQYDAESTIENIYALNIIMHVFFERRSKSKDQEIVDPG